MPAPMQDKRSTRRFALKLPVKVEGQNPHVAHTRDVSSRGICFYTDEKFESGSDLCFTLTLPSEITMTDPIEVFCSGRVVRVEEVPNGKLTVAAQIHQYQFVSAKPQ